MLTTDVEETLIYCWMLLQEFAKAKAAAETAAAAAGMSHCVQILIVFF